MDLVLSSFPLHRIIKLNRVSSTWNCLSSIQLHFTGGISSDILRSSSQNEAARETELNVAKTIGQISMKVYNAEKFKSGLKFDEAARDNSAAAHQQVSLEGGDDQQPSTILSIEYFQGMWETIDVPAGHEIIGLYGCASEEFLTSLGFIVWKPNPFAV